jgi:deoxyribonuclease-4
MRALQIFTAIPKYYGDKSSIRPERVTRFRETLARSGSRPSTWWCTRLRAQHAPHDEEKVGPGERGLRKELERSTRSA